MGRVRDPVELAVARARRNRIYRPRLLGGRANYSAGSDPPRRLGC
jgi:hypothetical protein